MGARKAVGPFLTQVVERAPFVHTITNMVTVNDCANAILAVGGSPTMAHHVEEVAEVTARCDALVLNMGAIEDLEAMLVAGKAAAKAGHPIVLDPVAAGASKIRREAAHRLLTELPLAVIRGNSTEIRALALGTDGGRGVDATAEDLVHTGNLAGSIAIAQKLAKDTGAVVVVSGPLDIVVDGTRSVALANGCATMSRITGTGCMLTAITGAFCGANPEDCFHAAVAATAAMGIAGEVAERLRLEKGTGTGTYHIDLIDALSNLTPDQLDGGIRYENYP